MHFRKQLCKLAKIIDFGFAGARGEQFVTAPFASPRRLDGAEPTEDCDLYSYRQLANHLWKPWGGKAPVTEIEKSCSRGIHRRHLAKQVQTLLQRQDPRTQKLSAAPAGSQWPRRIKYICFGVVFSALLFNPFGVQWNVDYAPLELRSQSWFQFSINELPAQYGPYTSRLRKGRYFLQWHNTKNNQKLQWNHSRAKTFLLQPESKPL